MDDKKKQLIRCRLRCILGIMEAQRSGADIHLIQNIRASALLLMDMLEKDKANFDLAIRTVRHLEDKTVAFVRKWYAGPN